MKFCVLGSVEVTAGSSRLDLGGVRQRTILGYLVLHAGTVVPANRLLRALWPGSPPATARKMVQNGVSALRRVLTAPVLCGEPAGYRLHVDPADVDLFEFRLLALRGRAAMVEGDPARGAALLREGLSRWRGPAFADLVESGVRWPELAAIEDERLSAVEDWLDAELACGRHREITSELEVLTATDPPRERLCRQFMVALYRSGRQADALRVYRRTQAALGREPGWELQELRRQILAHGTSDVLLSGYPAVDFPKAG
jgi:DNA-binding SARP family transcriptional activator